MSILRITRGKVKPGTWDQYEAVLRETIAAAGQVPGLLSRTLARDADDPDSGFAISLWDSEEALAQYESSQATDQARAKLHRFFVGDYSSSLCEVRWWDETAFDDSPEI